MRQTLDDFESVSERHALSPARLSAHQYALTLDRGMSGKGQNFRYALGLPRMSAYHYALTLFRARDAYPDHQKKWQPSIDYRPMEPDLAYIRSQHVNVCEEISLVRRFMADHGYSQEYIDDNLPYPEDPSIKFLAEQRARHAETLKVIEDYYAAQGSSPETKIEES